MGWGGLGCGGWRWGGGGGEESFLPWNVRVVVDVAFLLFSLQRDSISILVS